MCGCSFPLFLVSLLVQVQAFVCARAAVSSDNVFVHDAL
jgi:hypothetical protein